MDYPLGVTKLKCMKFGMSLNPYSNGLPSRGAKIEDLKAQLSAVLIPILMDYPLGVMATMFVNLYGLVLIPILMDYPLGAIF